MEGSHGSNNRVPGIKRSKVRKRTSFKALSKPLKGQARPAPIGRCDARHDARLADFKERGSLQLNYKFKSPSPFRFKSVCQKNKRSGPAPFPKSLTRPRQRDANRRLMPTLARFLGGDGRLIGTQIHRENPDRVREFRSVEGRHQRGVDNK